MVTTNRKFPLHKLVIAGKEIDIGNNINIVRDLDVLPNNMTMTLPYFDNDNWSTKDLKRYDRVQIYFKLFNSDDERRSASVSDMKQVIDGYLDNFSTSESKTTGEEYVLTILSTMGLSYERTTETKFFNDNIQGVVTKGITETELNSIIPEVVIEGVSSNLIVDVDSTNFFGEVLDNIKKDFAINIYQQGDGKLVLRTPQFFNIQTSIREFDVTDSISNIDYGDNNNAVDSVIVYGNNVVGIAFDPISYQLKNGVKPNDLTDNTTPDVNKLNPLKIFRRDLFSEEDCQELARNLLVKTARNYSLTFDTELDPEIELGEMFIIKNSNRVSVDQKFIIKKLTLTIEKSKINLNVVAYANAIRDFPDDILLPSSGLLDTDMLDITNKQNDLIDSIMRN